MKPRLPREWYQKDQTSREEITRNRLFMWEIRENRGRVKDGKNLSRNRKDYSKVYQHHSQMTHE